MGILGTTEYTARQLLLMAGAWDFAIAFVIFIPGLNIFSLVFATFWGIATAVARMWANIHIEDILIGFHQWGFESLLRLAHGLVPFVIIGHLVNFELLFKKAIKLKFD